MSYHRWRLLAGALPLIALLALAGCYTQLGTVRSEREPDNSYNDEQAYSADEDTTQVWTEEEENYANDNDYWDYRPRLGFMYYYPSIYFGMTNYDPWYWDSWYWPRGAYYSYYDPFICGTLYPWYYAGWYHPGVGYYDPWYYGNYYRYRDYGGGYGSTRTFGNTRGGGGVRSAGSTRGGEPAYGSPSSVGELPGAYRSAGSSPRGSATTGTQGVSRGKRSGDQSARQGTRPGTVQRGGNTRSGGSRQGTRSVPPRVRPPRSNPPPKDSGGARRSGGSHSSGAPSYSPPAPAPSSPPAPSGGGTRSSGGGTRSSGGGSRGGSRR
jgi:hypothetical protein